jgi:RHS repeat-associated protein
MAAAALLSLACASQALAQSIPAAGPIRKFVDANSVDLLTGFIYFNFPTLSIGRPGAGGLSITQTYYESSGSTNDLTGYVAASGSTYTVSFGTSTETFTSTDGVHFSNNQGAASMLSTNGTNYFYTLGDGTVVKYIIPGQTYYMNTIAQISYPTGEIWTFNYVPVGSLSINVVQSVTSNRGYQLHFDYPAGGYYPNKTTLFNEAVDYCSPTAGSCSFSQAWPNSADPLNRSPTFNTIGGYTIAYPSGFTLTYAVDSFLRITSVSNGTGTWTYVYSDNAGVRTTTVTDPQGHQRVVVSNLATGLVSTDTLVVPGGPNRVTSYQYDPTYGRVTQVTLPEGGYTQYAYDARGNATTTTMVSKTPGTPANIVVSAGFDATCSSPAKCNQPNYVIDARGNQTDYTYNLTTGQPLTVTAPAPTAGAVRPQTRYSYASLNAWYRNASGQIVQDPNPVSVLTGVSACQTQSACSGGLDEVKTTVGYPAGSASLATNVLPSSASTGAGDGSLTATTSTTYDAVGNVSTVQGPLGAAQTTQYYYDTGRELVGAVGPDPDGGGALLNRAVRTTYNADGLVTQLEQGTSSGYVNPTVSGFTSLAQQVMAYDGIDRKVRETTTGGGTTWAVTQYSYDNANRLQCTAVRMNPSAFGSLPSSACTLGSAGAYGTDRITYNSYDAADELTQVTTGYGDPAQRNVVTRTYSSDGLVKTVADGQGGLSTYVYDGFDRVYQLQFPNPSGGGSSTSDYQQFSYDAAANVTQIRRRDGQVVNLAYDALNRTLSKTPPESGQAVTYGYDNLGRVKSAVTAGQTVSLTYDALGRKLSETQPMGTVYSAWDVAGRRIRFTFSNGGYEAYDYDVMGELTAIRENGGTTLASYSYDNLGRRTALARVNGITTSYGYDAASNLTSLAHAGSSNNQSFTYAYNPAGQISSRTASNDAYAFAAASLNQPYVVNGLNQYTAVGGVAYGYDARGNLGSGTAKTYTYDSQNRLATASGSPAASLSYDPLDRLQQVAGASTTQFLYDGGQIVQEFVGGQVARYYVPGPGADEPVLWYDVTVSGDMYRWAMQDERGSVIAQADNSHQVVAINSYDDYGQPGSLNLGRFQYTGQAWIPEAGLYSFKARDYLPAIGRFAQTDPIGFDGGLNLYAYGLADPVNRTDPDGTAPCSSNCRPPDPPCPPAIVCVVGHRPEGLSNSPSGGLVAIGSWNLPSGFELPGQLPPGAQEAAKKVVAAVCTALRFGPDAMSVGYTWGKGKGAVGGQATIDSYGNIYLGGSAGIGSPGFSFAGQWVPTLSHFPKESEIVNRVSGSSTHMQLADVAGASYSHNSSGTLLGYVIGAGGFSGKSWNAKVGNICKGQR